MDRLGIVAGSGRLPLEAVDQCRRSGTGVFCVLLKSYADADDYRGVDFIELGVGQVGRMMDFFRQRGVTRLVLLGGVRKPSFGFLNMDREGALLAKDILKNRLLGDNSVLEVVVRFLEEHGFRVLEADSLLENLKLGAGPNNSVGCGQEYLRDIEIGRSLLEKLSEFDLGQAVAVQQGVVVALECLEGTAAMIKRAGKLGLPQGSRPVLVKTGKIGQTRKADLPSIGPHTIEQLYASGFAGAALDFKNCLVISRETTLEMAEKYNLFLWGIDGPQGQPGGE